MIGGILSTRLGQGIVAGVVGLAVVGGVAVYTASNTVPASQGGEGQGTVTGYVVSSLHYGLNGTDPTKIDSVTFSLDTAPASGSTIKAKLVSSGSTWYTCTNVGIAVTCSTTAPQALAAAVDQLSVVVAQ